MRKYTERPPTPQGRAEVRLLKDEIKLIDLDTSEVHHIDPADIGEDTVVKPGRNLFYRLSSDGRKLYGLNPWDGQYFLKVKAFLPPPRSENQTIPATYVLPGGKDMGGWVSRDRSVFNVLFEIIGGEFEGMSAVKMFTYLFRAGQEDLVEMVGSGGKAYQALEEFLGAAGFDWDKDNVQFSNNILPDLQDLLLKRGVVFLGKFEKGWLTSFSKPPAGMAPPTKKVRKPREKKVVVEGEPRDEPAEE